MFLRITSRLISSAALFAPSRHGIKRTSPLIQKARMFCEGRPIVFSIKTAEEFHEEVLNSEVPVIVDFHADWCGPCQTLGPRLEAKVNGRGGQVLMAKVNVDEAGELAMDYQVSAVPTVLAFHNGEIVTGFQGVIEDDQLEEFLDKAIEGQ